MRHLSNRLIDDCRGATTCCCCIHIETRRLDRTGQATTNFAVSLPKPQSDLARESLNDPTRLDSLGLGRKAGEREIENALVEPLPAELQTSLPSIEQIERELGGTANAIPSGNPAAHDEEP